MSRTRFILVICLLFPLLVSLTVLVLDIEARVDAIDPNDVKAIGYNLRTASYNLATTTWNARQATDTIAKAAPALADETEKLLGTAGKTMEAASETVEAVGVTVIDLQETIRKVRETVIPDVDAQVKAVNPILANAAYMTKQLAAAAPQVNHTLSVISDNADLLIQCASQDPDTGEWIGNQDCLANRLIPALKSIEHMSAAGEKMFAAVAAETPGTAQAVRGIAVNVDHATGTLDNAVTRYFAPVPWRDKLLKLLPVIGEGIVLGKAAAK